MQSVVVQLMNAASGEYHDIHSGKVVLPETKGITSKPLEAITGNGVPHIFLADYQAKAGISQGIETHKRHHAFAMNLDICMLENVTVIPGVKQA
ncbi:hypothetical protein VRRI112168_04800 [Vreelandella rituensis]